jgi:ribosomal protein S27AE
MNGYFIEQVSMVDPSRVYCAKCGVQAEKKVGMWFVAIGQDKKPAKFYVDEKGNSIQKNDLCPDCIKEVLIEAVLKGEHNAE